MRSTPRSRRFGLAVAAITALGLGLPGLAQASPPPEHQPRTATAQQADVQITLVTGDRVTLIGGDPTRAAVEPGPGRKGITFGTQRTKDHLYVVPSDVQHQVAGGRLDRRLFDVTGLIKAGYDDKSAKAIPVVVTYTGKAQPRSAAPGATVTRQLPVVNGTAMKVDKTKSAGFLAGVTSARSAAGVEKVWLDGKREVSLDQSVPQIGAPAAWEAGYTGKGVSVAVLDTGIDKSHPDLASQVAGAKNFTEESAEDLVGHGTHVASTIAGTAAASSGKYKGVAPDAKLYDGKVCEQGGCPESAILGGMEWAANEVKAKVVNLSLGGTDTPEVDPLEEAVNRLTAQTGTLFVIAAGNDGPGESTVGSPGSADSALTVGAVDKQDHLAEFSSRGPRVGDGAVKPDVTAPGVDIVAAKAAKSIIGEPVGDQYLTLSGTSMATPHTAGAAALLAQQHPDWKAGDLKAALMASAKPADGQTAFEQGTGRIDVAKGIKQAVVTDPGSVSFGTAIWPHDDDTPVTKTLTYRNLGDQAVTLDLAATLSGPNGQPAPAGALTLSATTVTVPAGGTASVQATSNTNHSGPDGGYSGRITATGGDTTVVSAVGVNKEKESYDLTVSNVGVDGKPALAFGVLFGLDTDLFTFLGGTTTKIRLPKGEYSVQGDQVVERPGGEGQDFYSLVQPSIKLTGNTTVVLDARAAKPVKVTVPKADAAVALAVLGYDRTSPDGRRGLGSSALLFEFDGVHSGQVGPALPPEQMTGNVASQWAKPDADQSFANSPYLYGQVDSTPGVFPTGFVRNLKAKDLAVVDQTLNATGDRQLERTVHGRAPYMNGSWAVILPYDVPATTKVLVDDKPAVWNHTVSEIAPSPDPEDPFPVTISRLTSPEKEYAAGRTYRERYNAAAFTATPELASRSENDLLLSAYSLSDADGTKGFGLMDTQSSTLLRDGKVVAESPYFGYIEATGLPAEKATYTLESSQTRPTYSTFSTRTDLRWTFTSAATTEPTTLPMLGLRYQPKVDGHNVAERRPVTVLPVIVDGVPGEELPRVKKLELQVSGDNGTTWHKAAVVPAGKGTYKAIFATPKAAKTVSLKAKLIDAQGNITEQTVIGAYPLR
ncbi:S8 family serine peptidase [Kribbella sp. CA-247076]|uniref:S8 family serine peptidase n=1 Tax=Kribbella sp. CA-247076 TaxID=3239941 RepID=UPI003D94E52D